MEKEKEKTIRFTTDQSLEFIKMPAKPPKMSKNPTQEQLDDYSKTLEQYFKDKERELAEQQLESDRTLAELNKEKANVELKERETLELQEKNAALQAELEKHMADLDLRRQSHEDVWREEASKLDKRRVELVEERRRLEKLAIEIEHSKGVGSGTGEEDTLKFMQQQQDLLTKITLLEEKREIRETEEIREAQTEGQHWQRSETSNLQRRQGRKT